MPYTNAPATATTAACDDVMVYPCFGYINRDISEKTIERDTGDSVLPDLAIVFKHVTLYFHVGYTSEGNRICLHTTSDDVAAYLQIMRRVLRVPFKENTRLIGINKAADDTPYGQDEFTLGMDFFEETMIVLDFERNLLWVRNPLQSLAS